MEKKKPHPLYTSLLIRPQLTLQSLQIEVMGRLKTIKIFQNLATRLIFDGRDVFKDKKTDPLKSRKADLPSLFQPSFFRDAFQPIEADLFEEKKTRGREAISFILLKCFPHSKSRHIPYFTLVFEIDQPATCFCGSIALNT